MYKLKELAEYVGGSVVGDAEMGIKGLQPFDSAQAGDLTLATERSYLQQIGSTGASAVIVPRDFLTTEKTVVQTANPKLAFAHLLGLFHQKPFTPTGISPWAVVGTGCRISDQVTIHPFVWIGDEVDVGERVTLLSGVHVGHRTRIGDESILHANVVVYDDVTIGRRVILHSGTVIGADGFGYVFDGASHIRIPQTGTVIIGDDVEIGANSCVDRATFGATVIEQGVKLDNHVHIGHNCRIGQNTIMVAQVGISGSVEVGKNCIFAGHSGVTDHVKVGDGVQVMMKTAVSKDVPSGSVVSGQPAMDHREAMRIQAITRRLPEMYREWKKTRAG